MRKEEEGNQQNGNEHLPKTSNRVNEKYSKNFPEFKMYLNGFPDSSVVKNLPATQETQVPYLIQEDLTGRGATKPMCHFYQACALEPRSSATEARAP